MADTQIKITADNSQALRSIADINRALGGLQSSASGVNRTMGALTSTMQTLAGVVAGASLFNFIDGLQNMQNKLRIVANSNEEFTRSLAYVKAIADNTGQSVNAIGDVYAKVAANADKLGYSTEQVATVTNAMALALKASGASAEGSRSTLYQFGQILNKGKVNGDEFTTMVENLSGNVLNTLIKNMGLTRQEFEQFKTKGLIGSKDFTDALIRSIGELDRLQGKTMPTLGQSLQRIQNSFADFIIKLDRATGITNTLANAMTWLAKNVDTVLPLLAAMLGYLAAGRIVAFATAIYQAVAAMRALGIAAAVTQALATGGITAITGLAGAAAAFIAAKAVFDKVDDSVEGLNVNLNETAVAAQKGLGETNNQLVGIGDKLKEILRDLDQQIALGAMTERQYRIENEILGRNKDLGYQMTEAQKQELRIRLQKLDIIKAERDFIQIQQSYMGEMITALGMNLIQSKALADYEKLRSQYGEAFANSKRKEIESSARAVVLVQTEAKYLKENADAYEQLQLYKDYILKASSRDLDLNGELLRIQREIGTQLDQHVLAGIQKTEGYKRELGFLKQMKQATEAVNTPLGGAAAGAQAAGQLGQLDPVKSAMTANQTLMAGLQELRNRDLISAQQYETAKVNAAVMGTEAIMAAQKKQFENEALLRIQSKTGSTFGFETQKQMAAEAAAFEMKSTTEKTAFAIDQGAQMFNALGQHNKKAFEAAKAFNIANAIMNTYMAATKALATYPPPINFFMMGAAITLGLAQVAQIRSQQYSGRALGGPVMGGTPYIVGESGPELFTPNTTGSITRNGDFGGGSNVNVNFTINAVDAEGIDNLLIERRGTIQQIISDAMLEKGQRM